MNVFAYEKDQDGIVTVTMNMTGPVNCMNQEYRDAMEATVSRLEVEPGLTGVVFASAKNVFFAGGDLAEMLAFKPADAAPLLALVTTMKGHFRRLEKLPVPVVAAINGAALGGGFELCLACNYRIAVDDRAVQIGLPEVTLGLLPGAGGVVRMVHLLGLEKALPFLMEGKKVGATAALEAGLIHEVVESALQLVARAKAWIVEQGTQETATTQAWDRKGHRIPGGAAGSPALAQLIGMAPPMLRKKTRGLLPAPEHVLDCAIEAARLDFDTALKVESRRLIYLLGTPQAKNLISSMFFQMGQVRGGASRPPGHPKNVVVKVAVLGAGMMGQGIAYACAMAGIDVVLKDISVDAAAKGKAYTEALLGKRVAKGQMDAAKMASVLALIHPSADNADLDGSDVIIETVFENIALKKKVCAETERYLAPGGVYASNTSSLPITDLASAATAPQNYIGIHFFSPVDRMELVELICGEMTSEAALAKAFDFVLQIRKTPIVVNDSLGFFTSRTFATYLDEGVRLLHEGIDPVRIDAQGKAVGMPLGPLAVHDETSLELSRKGAATWKEMGVLDKFGEQQIFREVIDTMIGQYGRGGRHHGGGFYAYAEGGGKTIWPQLYALYHKPAHSIADQDIRDRLLFRLVIESLRCLQEGVLRTVADGNIGSLLGIGAPAWTGGFIQFVNTYGADRFVARCRQLATQYGPRFEPPAIASEKAQRGELFA